MDQDHELHTKLDNAVWITSSLFARGKTSGSSGNLSFRHWEHMYITGSGTCFGTLKKHDFSILDLNGNYVSGVKPSKEYPLHLITYHKNQNIQAVIHTHSFYVTLWSCCLEEQARVVVPKHTPYLEMKLGQIGLIPYAPPGTQELFDAYKNGYKPECRGYILKNHGSIVGDVDLFSAFHSLEELEESCHVAWQLRGEICGVLP